MRREVCRIVGAAACAVTIACGHADAPSSGSADAPKPTSTNVAAPKSEPKEPAATPIFPPGLSIGEECPAATSSPTGPLAAASALVPLKEGLTLSHTWSSNVDDHHDYECLVQVAAITASYVDVTQSCGVEGRTIADRRRVCLDDLESAFFYETETFNE